MCERHSNVGKMNCTCDGFISRKLAQGSRAKQSVTHSAFRIVARQRACPNWCHASKTQLGCARYPPVSVFMLVLSRSYRAGACTIKVSASVIRRRDLRGARYKESGCADHTPICPHREIHCCASSCVEVVSSWMWFRIIGR